MTDKLKVAKIQIVSIVVILAFVFGFSFYALNFQIKENTSQIQKNTIWILDHDAAWKPDEEKPE